MPVIEMTNIIEEANHLLATAALGSPALGSNTAVHADITLSAGGTATTGITNPDVPRNLVIKGTGAGATGNVVLTGTNAEGKVITETIALAGAAAVVGAKAFKTLVSILYPADSGATGEKVSIGTGSKLGIGRRLTRNSVRSAYLAGVLEGTAPTIVTSASLLESNTASLNSALNGTAVVLDYVDY